MSRRSISALISSGFSSSASTWVQTSSSISSIRTGRCGADASLGAAEAVGSRAAVVVVHVPGLAAGGAAVVGVAALAADQDPLQQRGLAGVARREAAVALEQLLSERVLLLADQRRHRDPQPVLRPDVLVGGATGMPAPLACHAHRLRRRRRSRAGDRKPPGRCRRGCAGSPRSSTGPSAAFRSGSARPARSATRAIWTIDSRCST